MEKIFIKMEYRDYAENLIFLENRENLFNMKLREYNKTSKNLGIDASVDQFWKDLNILKSFVIFRSLLKCIENKKKLKNCANFPLSSWSLF